MSEARGVAAFMAPPPQDDSSMPSDKGKEPVDAPAKTTEEEPKYEILEEGDEEKLIGRSVELSSRIITNANTGNYRADDEEEEAYDPRLSKNKTKAKNNDDMFGDDDDDDDDDMFIDNGAGVGGDITGSKRKRNHDSASRQGQRAHVNAATSEGVEQEEEEEENDGFLEEDLLRKKKRGKSAAMASAQMTGDESGSEDEDGVELDGAGKIKRSRKNKKNKGNDDDPEDDPLSADEGDDEDRAENETEEMYRERKKKHLGATRGEAASSKLMYLDGHKLEPFNLDEERKKGHFDDMGHYVEEAKDSDDDEPDDPWLEEVDAAQEQLAAQLAGDKGSLSAARFYDSRFDGKKDKGKGKASDGGEESVQMTEGAAVKTLVRCLAPGENVRGALRRLKKEDDLQGVADVTDAAAILFAAGKMDTFDAEREEYVTEVFEANLTRAFRAAADLDRMYARAAVEAGQPPPAPGSMDGQQSVQWEFKWSPEPDAEVHGPAPTSSMVTWGKQKAFGVETPVWVRRAGEQGEWTAGVEVDWLAAMKECISAAATSLTKKT